MYERSRSPRAPSASAGSGDAPCVYAHGTRRPERLVLLEQPPWSNICWTRWQGTVGSARALLQGTQKLDDDSFIEVVIQAVAIESAANAVAIESVQDRWWPDAATKRPHNQIQVGQCQQICRAPGRGVPAQVSRRASQRSDVTSGESRPRVNLVPRVDRGDDGSISFRGR